MIVTPDWPARYMLGLPPTIAVNLGSNPPHWQLARRPHGPRWSRTRSDYLFHRLLNPEYSSKIIQVNQGLLCSIWFWYKVQFVLYLALPSDGQRHTNLDFCYLLGGISSRTIKFGIWHLSTVGSINMTTSDFPVQFYNHQVLPQQLLSKFLNRFTDCKTKNFLKPF